MSEKAQCSYCGTLVGNINFDIFTEKYYCENPECVKKARRDTKEYFKQREIKISKPFKLKDISNQQEFEDMIYALYGEIERQGKIKEMGPMQEPDFFKNRAMYLIASELPEEYVKIKMGKKDKTKVVVEILKTIPKKEIKRAMEKANLL